MVSNENIFLHVLYFNCDFFVATNFSKIISEQESAQQDLATSLANNKALLQGVQEAFAVNLENVNKEVAKLEERLKTVTTGK